MTSPFDGDDDAFLCNEGHEPIVDDIFAKDFDRILAEFMRDAPQDLVMDEETTRHPSLVDPKLDYAEVPAGVMLLDGDRAVGGYLSCDLGLDPAYRGRGLGAEIVIERCLRHGDNPVLDLDEAAYSRAGIAAHRAAWRRARRNETETALRRARLEENP